MITLFFAVAMAILLALTGWDASAWWAVGIAVVAAGVSFLLEDINETP